MSTGKASRRYQFSSALLNEYSLISPFYNLFRTDRVSTQVIFALDATKIFPHPLLPHALL
jgi:hypothetical protein